jgi:coenzyme F420-0:L-glutamate ligase/coenzyme F420-1:gamma-L-glutamate ligase
MSIPETPNMLLMELIRQRRSIRRYQERPIPPELIDALVEGAIWAPSAHNRQPWRLAILRSAASRESLARAMGDQLRRDLEADGLPEAQIAQDVGRSYQRIVGAAAGIVLCLTMADMDRYADVDRQAAEHQMAVQSAAMAGQNLLLMASASGLGACWMCAPLFCPDVVRDVLALPADWEPQALITLGYPGETRTKTRQSIESRVVWR